MTEPVASVFTMTNNINIDIDQYQYPQYLFKEFGLKLGGSDTVSSMFTMANHWVLLISAAIAYEIARMRCFSQEFLKCLHSFAEYEVIIKILKIRSSASRYKIFIDIYRWQKLYE